MRDLIVKIANLLGLYQLLVKIDTMFRNYKMNRNFKKYGKETLSLLNDTCSEIGIRLFPTFGILLGAYRDHNFIPYDNDLDVGILIKERPNDMQERMLQYGFYCKRQFYIPSLNRITEEQYLYKGVQVDIFYYFEENEDWFAYCARRHEFKEWKEANRTDGFPMVRSYVPKTSLIKQEFLGIMIYMPEKTSQWLTDIYSDSFMTPIKNWEAKNYHTRIISVPERGYRRYFD